MVQLLQVGIRVFDMGNYSKPMCTLPHVRGISWFRRAHTGDV